jgi:GST-like protein
MDPGSGQAHLDVAAYQHLQRWARQIQARPAVQRGQRVNKTWGDESEQLRERHDASDLD